MSRASAPGERIDDPRPARDGGLRFEAMPLLRGRVTEARADVKRESEICSRQLAETTKAPEGACVAYQLKLGARRRRTPSRKESNVARQLNERQDQMVPGEGVEPSLPGPTPGVLPLNDPGMAGRTGVEPVSPGSEPGVRATRPPSIGTAFSASSMEDSNLRPPVPQTGALPLRQCSLIERPHPSWHSWRPTLCSPLLRREPGTRTQSFARPRGVCFHRHSFPVVRSGLETMPGSATRTWPC